ncbi:hypothetical protein GINT2_000907 [Glugoides intestinalis]
MSKPDSTDISDPVNTLAINAVSWASYFFKFLSTYIEDLLVLKNNPEGSSIKELLHNPKALTCLLISLFGIYCLFIGIWSKKTSIFVVSFYISYSITKHFSNVFDVPAEKIHTFLILRFPKIFGTLFDPQPDFHLGYIVISFIGALILTYFLSWTRIMAMISMTAFAYELLKSCGIIDPLNLRNTSLLKCAIIILAFCFIAILAYYIEDTVVMLIVCFVGSSILFCCVFCFFNFPPDFGNYIDFSSSSQTLKEIAYNVNFLFIFFLAIVSMSLQTILYLK